MNDLKPTDIGRIEPRSYMEKSIWALDVVLDLFKKYGPVGSYKRLVDNSLLHAKTMDELKKHKPFVQEFCPEFLSLFDDLSNTELRVTKDNERSVNFLANYTPWPYPLNPKWFDIYIDALDRFKGDCKSTGFSGLYSREFCNRYIPDMPEPLLRMVTGEDPVDRFGIFLKYKEAMRLGEEKTLILDTQIKMLRALTNKEKKFNRGLVYRMAVTCNLIKMNCTLMDVAQEPWFVECLRLEGVSLKDLGF